MGMTETARVLIVDDEPLNVDMLKKRLTRRGYVVDEAFSAAEALVKIQSEKPDIILLDVFMPDVSGYDLLVQLRADDRTRSIPVILVSARGGAESVVEGLKKGANDYVSKPVNLEVLLARLETHLQMSHMVKQLESQTTMLGRLAAVDELTGLPNRRVMFQSLHEEMQRCTRYGTPVSAMMLDLDHFKSVNDTYGHSAGDSVLKEFARRILEKVRATDIICRYGGEEFCAILPQTTVENASDAAEHIRKTIECLPFKVGDHMLRITVSIGIASFCSHDNGSADELLERADRALYEAKNSGRNRVCSFGEVPVPGPLD